MKHKKKYTQRRGGENTENNSKKSMFSMFSKKKTNAKKSKKKGMFGWFSKKNNTKNKKNNNENKKNNTENTENNNNENTEKKDPLLNVYKSPKTQCFKKFKLNKLDELVINLQGLKKDIDEVISKNKSEAKTNKKPISSCDIRFGEISKLFAQSINLFENDQIRMNKITIPNINENVTQIETGTGETQIETGKNATQSEKGTNVNPVSNSHNVSNKKTSMFDKMKEFNPLNTAKSYAEKAGLTGSETPMNKLKGVAKGVSEKAREKLEGLSGTSGSPMNKLKGIASKLTKKSIGGSTNNSACNSYISIGPKIQFCIDELDKLIAKEPEFIECPTLNIIFKKLKETKANLTLALEKLNK